MAYQEDIDKIKQLRELARQKNKETASLTTSGQTFRDNIMKKVRAKRVERGFNVLSSGQGQTTGELASANPELRARVGDNLNPLMTDVLTSNQRGQLLDTLATVSSMQKQNTGTVEDMIGAGSNRLKAMAMAKAAEAQQASSEANDLLNQVKMKEAEASRKFSENLALKKFNLTKKSADRSDKTQYRFLTVYDENGSPKVVAVDPYTGKVATTVGTSGKTKSSDLKIQVANDASNGMSLVDLGKKYPTISSNILSDLYERNKPDWWTNVSNWVGGLFNKKQSNSATLKSKPSIESFYK